MPELTALRPMSTSQVLDRTFSLYRRHFLLFAGIATLAPALLLVGRLLMLGGGALAPRFSGSVAYWIPVVTGAVLWAVLYLLSTALATGATVYAVSRVHLGFSITITAAYQAVRGAVWRMLGISILIGLMSGGAFALGYSTILLPIMMIPGMRGAGPLMGILLGLLAFAAIVAAGVWAIRLYCRYSLAVPACVVEGLPVMISLRRSKFLTKDFLGRIFLVYLLLVVLGIALGLVLSLPTMVGVIASGGKQALPFQLWSLFADFLAGTLSQPISTIAIALIYYDQRVRKEAFDLQLMMDAVGQPAPVATAAATPSAG